MKGYYYQSKQIPFEHLLRAREARYYCAILYVERGIAGIQGT